MAPEALQRMFIGGEWVDSAESDDIVNPADGEIVATVARGSAAHVDQAVDAALAAHRSGVWRSRPVAERVAVLKAAGARLGDRLEELAVLQSLENGAPLRLSAAFQIGAPLAHWDYLVSLAETYEFVRQGPAMAPFAADGVLRRDPIGVCAAIVPWNMPLLLTVWKVAPALVSGNTMVLKPDEKTPLLALELARELEAAGLPAGVFNVVTGSGEEVGAALVRHPAVRKVAFTGSTPVGREIMREAAGDLKRVTLELGGKGPAVVLEDADLEVAVDGVLFGAMTSTGQACSAGTRLLLPDALHDEFVVRLVARAESLRVGPDPLSPQTDMGPLISAGQRDLVLAFLKRAVEEGATIATGGGVPNGAEYEAGHWLKPTIVTGLRPDMEIARQEVFGPVLGVLRYGSLEEAVEIANDTPYGLTAGVWGRDEKRAAAVAEQLDAGAVWINSWHLISPGYPFGGTKQSGIGRELGPEALDAYTESRYIAIDHAPTAAQKGFGVLVGALGVPGD
jgi:aldehyde dehydrogenase (NAD+)